MIIGRSTNGPGSSTEEEVGVFDDVVLMTLELSSSRPRVI